MTRRSLVLALVMAMAWGVVGLVVDRPLHTAHEAQLAEAVGAIRAVIAEAGESIRRDAALLARSLLIVQGERDGEWFNLSSPQQTLIFSVTRGAARLHIVSPSGTPLAQAEGQTLPSIAPPEKPVTGLRVLDDRPWILGIAPLVGMARSGGAVPGAFGMVILGRVLDTLDLDRAPARPALVTVSGDRAVMRPRAAPEIGWRAATEARAILIDHEWHALRAVADFDSGESLWALMREPQYRTSRRWRWGFVAAGAVISFALALWTGRRAT